MEGFKNRRDFGIIISGCETDKLTSDVVALLQESNVRFILCPDLYETAAELTRHQAPKGMIIGRLEKLSSEKGYFLEKAVNKGWLCCCLAKKISGNTRNLAVRAMKSGAVVINDPGQLEKVITHITNG